MLNEYKEYYDYTRDLRIKDMKIEKFSGTSNIYGRLQHITIVKRFGLRRVLTIIARRVLFHDLRDVSKIIEYDSEIPPLRIEKAKKAIRNWCSYKLVENPDLPDLKGIKNNGVFFDYMNSAADFYVELLTTRFDLSKKKRKEYEKKKEKIEKQSDFWKEKYYEEYINKNFYSLNDKVKGKFNSKSFTVDSIIADAINSKELKNLFVEINPDVVNYLHKSLNIEYNSFIPDIILIASIYKLKCELNDNKYQILNIYEISNWLGKRLDKDDLKLNLSILNNLDIYGEDIISNSTKKVYFNEEIINCISIIDSSQSDNVSKSSLLINDDIGFHGFRLEINNLYKKVKS